VQLLHPFDVVIQRIRHRFRQPALTASYGNASDGVFDRMAWFEPQAFSNTVGINMIQRREPYKIKGTPYYDLEKKEYGTWLDDLM